MIRNRKIILLGRLFVWTAVAVNVGLISRSQQIEIINNSDGSQKKLKAVFQKHKRSILVGLLATLGASLEIYDRSIVLYYHRLKLEILRRFLDQVAVFVFLAFQDQVYYPNLNLKMVTFLNGCLNELVIIFAVFRGEQPSRRHRQMILAHGFSVLKANNFELNSRELSILYEVTNAFLLIAPVGKTNLKTFYTIMFSWINLNSLPVEGSLFDRSPLIVRALCLKILNKLHSERNRNRTSDSHSLAFLVRGGQQTFCTVSDFFVSKISTIALLMIALKLSELTPVVSPTTISGLSEGIVTISLVPYLSESTTEGSLETNEGILETTPETVETNEKILETTPEKVETTPEKVEATSKQRPEGTGSSPSVERKKRYRRKKRRVNTLFTVEQDLREEEKALRADKGTSSKIEFEEDHENYFPQSYPERVRERVRIRKD